MSDLAQTYISLTDDSINPTVGSTEIPLYFIATRENKVVDETTNKIAPGTMKSVANELMVFNSSKDAMDSFGIPVFEENNGTINQASETNEVGLYGLCDVLGITNTAYVVRADIDLGQLDPSTTAPTSLAKNGTKWFDLGNSSMGYFRANGNSKPALAWDSVDVAFIPESSMGDDGKPLPTVGSYGTIGMTISGETYKTYENLGDAWYEIGSEDWVAKYPSSAMSGNSTLPVAESTFSINGTTVTVDETVSTMDKFVELINNTFADGSVVATNVNGKLKITKTKGLLELVDGTNTPLTVMGFAKDESGKFVVNGVALYHSSHTNYPNGSVAGSIWVKTTSPNNGSNYVVKVYNASTGIWQVMACPLYNSFLTAEAAIGATLQSGSMFAMYDDTTEMKILSFQGANSFGISGDAENPAVTADDEITISTINNGVISSTNVKFTGSDVASAIIDINSAAISGVTAELASDGKNIYIVSNNGFAVAFANKTGDSLASLGLSEGEFSNWVMAGVIASVNEPASDPEEGTLWLNPDFQADIMVNDGKSWKGYNNTLATASCDKNGVQLTSEEPTTQSDGKPLVDGDLWLNTADAENYPALYRYSDGAWEIVDKTDQTTPMGIVFADARENAGPDYEGSTHVAFSVRGEDLVKSDYVDPDCPDPRAYAAGTILFNMRYATNNVKKYEPNKFENAVSELGETFKVGGDDTTPSFPTPGTDENPSIARWTGASGNGSDGAGLFGRKAQRKMVVNALAESIKSNEDIRSSIYDFIVACAPGYPELDDELVALSADKKDLVYTISDTPKRLAPKSNDIIQWATNYNNASTNGEEGRTVSSYMLSRQYPPMALTSNVDGNEIAVPSSIVKMRNFLQVPAGQCAAGLTYGVVGNASTVGYISEENEYVPVAMRDGVGQACASNKINPILYRNNSLVFWDEQTENNVDSMLSDEHNVKTILHLKRDLDATAQPFFFKINTPALRDDFKNALMGVLSNYVARGQIYDYLVVVDDSNNTPTTIARRELWGDVAVALTSAIRYIYIPIRAQSIATFNK